MVRPGVPTWEVGQLVAVYRFGDLHGRPATATRDEVTETRANTIKLASGKVFTYGGLEYGRKSSDLRLRRLDDPDVVRALARQDFEALQVEVSQAALNIGQADEERLRAALNVLKGAGGENG